MGRTYVVGMMMMDTPVCCQKKTSWSGWTTRSNRVEACWVLSVVGGRMWCRCDAMSGPLIGSQRGPRPLCGSDGTTKDGGMYVSSDEWHTSDDNGGTESRRL